jgi:hypothetical protein
MSVHGPQPLRRPAAIRPSVRPADIRRCLAR